MDQETNRLSRELGLTDAVGVGLGAIIGAGIFVVTGVAAGVAGPAFIIGLFFAGIIAACNGLSSAQLAASYPQSGGTYEYGYRLLNPVLGFSAGWMFLVSKLSAAGVVAIGFGNYFHQLLPGVSPLFISVAAVIFLTVLNYFGIKKAGKLNLVIVAITLFSLLFLIATGVSSVKAENFRPFNPFGISGIAESAALLFFAFTGYARIATLAEEVHDPEKTIPRAVIITIVSAIFLYLAVSIVAMGVIGQEGMLSISPLQTAGKAISPATSLIITIGASTAMLGVLLSQILGISRMMFAMSRRNDLPGIFETVHAKYKVPHAGVLITGIFILILTLINSIQFILMAATFTILLYYSITNIAAMKQPIEQRKFGRIIPVIGLAGCFVMAFSLDWKGILAGLVLLVSGLVFRFLLQRMNGKSGVSY